MIQFGYFNKQCLATKLYHILSIDIRFNSSYYTHYICTHYGIPYCTHIEGTWSVYVGLKMAAMRSKYVAKNF